MVKQIFFNSRLEIYSYRQLDDNPRIDAMVHTAISAAKCKPKLDYQVGVVMRWLYPNELNKLIN